MASGAAGHHSSESTGGGGGGFHSESSCATPATETTVARRLLNGLDIKEGDDGAASSSPQQAARKTKKRGNRAVGPDKNARGLRHCTIRVCEIVKRKERTTYNEVADELVAEYSDPNTNIHSPDPENDSAQQEKNIHRRVYDALNVLTATGIIFIHKKEIQWRGLPKTSRSIDGYLKLKDRVDKKEKYLQDLQDQYDGLQKLIDRNKQLQPGDASSCRMALHLY